MDRMMGIVFKLRFGIAAMGYKQLSEYFAS